MIFSLSYPVFHCATILSFCPGIFGLFAVFASKNNFVMNIPVCETYGTCARFPQNTWLQGEQLHNVMLYFCHLHRVRVPLISILSNLSRSKIMYHLVSVSTSWLLTRLIIFSCAFQSVMDLLWSACWCIVFPFFFLRLLFLLIFKKFFINTGY